MSRTMSPKTDDGIIVAKLLWRFGDLDDISGDRGGKGNHPHATAE